MDNDLWTLPIQPREVQIDALNKGYGKTGFAYFVRQRLGKTWLAYAEYVKLREEGLVDWMILICPNSIKDQWLAAIEEVEETIPVFVYRANRKHQLEHFQKSAKRGVFIINYESLKSFVLSDKTFPWERCYLVADESTKIKDPRAKSTKAALTLAQICAYKRVLTGKPTANNNGDLWAQLKFIGATPYNYHQFKEMFTASGGFKGKQIVRNINTHVLRASMQPHCYIAPDKYLVDFEKCYEPMRRITMSGEQDDLYQKMEYELVLELSKDVTITAPIALTKYLRLQQISSGVAGDIFGIQHNIIEPSSNPRIKIVREILDNEIDHRVIIACRFRLSIDNLKRELEKDGHKISVLLGGMSGKEIEEEKAKFNSGENKVLLGQLQVLAYGHTLPGPNTDPCDSMIFYENDFSLLNRVQCESRPEDKDRKVPISYYDMYASKMDAYIIESLRKKEDASMAIMGYARQFGIQPGAGNNASDSNAA
jgi:SNF2 family DNA or RNA helicase